MSLQQQRTKLVLWLIPVARVWALLALALALVPVLVAETVALGRIRFVQLLVFAAEASAGHGFEATRQPVRLV